MKNKLGASASPVPTPGSRSRGPLGFELQCRRAAPGGAARARTAPAASPSPNATAGSARAATGPARGAPRTANAGHRWEHSCWKSAFQSSGHLPADRTIWVLWQIHAYYEENKLFLVLQTILPMLSDYSHFRSPSHFKCTPLPRFTFRPSSPLLAPSPEGRWEAELIPHPSRWQPRGWNAAGPGGQAAGRWWCCPRNGRRWCWPREWEAAPGMRPPQHLPRAQVSAPRPNPRCRVPGNCSGRRDRWKTKWGAHPSFECRSSSSDVTDFGGWESRQTPGVSGLFCPLHTPGDTQERERGTLCPLKPLTGKTRERKKFQANKTQNTAGHIIRLYLKTCMQRQNREYLAYLLLIFHFYPRTTCSGGTHSDVRCPLFPQQIISIVHQVPEKDDNKADTALGSLYHQPGRAAEQSSVPAQPAHWPAPRTARYTRKYLQDRARILSTLLCYRSCLL